MNRIVAFLRKDGLVAASYRMNMILSVASLLTLVVPMFFIAGALQPVVGGAIASEGGEYFAFVVAGMATYQLVIAAVGSLPTAVATGLRTGTFEVMLTTPTRLPTLLLGMVSYPLAWAALRAGAMLGAGALLGASYAFDRIAIVIVIWAAIAMAYVPFGILAGALLIVTRTTGPLPGAVLTASMLLGGVYYPTHVIPSWLQHLSDAVPLTYGLRSMRRVLAADVRVSEVAFDLGIVVLLAAVLTSISLVAFNLALARARRSGSLAHY